MTPTCHRCGQPLDPLASHPTPNGPVHPACARPEDALRPAFDERDAIRAAPKYGGPPIYRVGVLAGAVSALTGIAWLLRQCGR